MTAQTRATLKSLFEYGDIPSGTNYGDAWDSFVNLLDTGTQTLSGTLVVPTLTVTTFSLDTFTANTLTTTNLTATTGTVTTLNSTTSTLSTATITTANTTNLSFSSQITTSVTTVSGVGTTQAGAASLVVPYGILSVAVGQTAFVLSAVVGRVQIVRNSSGATAALIYPPSGGQIDALGANNSFSLAAGNKIMIVCESSTQFTTFAF